MSTAETDIPDTTAPTTAPTTESTPPAAAPEAAPATALEELQHAMLGGLMGIIGAPDDPAVAQAGDEVVLRLDALLASQTPPA
ncbi:hypothetical protein [Streptomyces sp. NPDC088725]|uniref:hypothetical protein n=1 Tax=Streptomyces sp. NPDC088725 TaxID=3365873 RepID=UPI003829099D